MTKESAPDRTSREAFLDAAAEELADKGSAGVRLEHVARRAGYSTALIYRWFGDRGTLFKEALRRRFAARTDVLERLPPSLPEALVSWWQQTKADRLFVRLVLREALDHGGEEPVEAEYRRAYYARQIEMFRAFQKEGRIDPSLDAEMLFLAFLGLIFLPSALPQITQLATGLSADSEELDRRWSRLLEDLASRVALSEREQR